MSGASAGGVRRGSAVMAAGTAVSRVLGLVRNLVLVAAVGGTGTIADAFDVANKLPNFMYAIISAGVLNAMIVPQVVRAYASRNPQERLDKLLTVTGLALLVVTLGLTAGASGVVVFYLDDTWSAAQQALAVAFGFWCLPQLFFYGLYTLLGQVLNARSQFGPFMWAPVVNNVVSIVGFGAYLLIFGRYAVDSSTAAPESWSGPQIALLAGTATAGVALQALVLVLPLRRAGFRWRFRVGVRGIGLRSTGRVVGWALAAVLLDQAGIWFFTRLATGASEAAGGPAGEAVAGNMAYSQALMIYLLPHSLVTVSIATALFTGMSAAAAAQDLRRVRAIVSRGLRVVGVFTVLATAVMVVLSRPLTTVLVPTLTPDTARVVGEVLFAMALGLVPLGAMVLMKWVYFAFEDGRTVFWIQVPMTLVTVLGSWLATVVLEPRWWVVGIAASVSASNLVAVVLRIAGLRRLLGGLDVPGIVKLHVRASVAAAVSVVAGWCALRPFGDLGEASWAVCLGATAVVGAVMVVVYGLCLSVMRVEELGQLTGPVLARLRRR